MKALLHGLYDMLVHFQTSFIYCVFCVPSSIPFLKSAVIRYHLLSPKDNGNVFFSQYLG